MTKTLTEQWREGKIFGFYYVKVSGEETEIHNVSCMDYLLDKYGVKVLSLEVLAPVPDYSEYQALKDNCEFTHTVLKEAHQKITQLENKLEIATKALKKYESTAGCGREAFLALKEMEGVK